MEYFILLFQTHKVEMTQALTTEPILQAELMYDIKVFEQAEKAKEVQRLKKQKEEKERRLEEDLHALQSEYMDMELDSANNQPEGIASNYSSAAGTPAPMSTTSTPALPSGSSTSSKLASCTPSLKTCLSSEIEATPSSNNRQLNRTARLSSGTPKTPKSNRTPNSMLASIGMLLSVTV